MRDLTFFNDGNRKKLKNGLFNFSKLRTVVLKVCRTKKDLVQLNLHMCKVGLNKMVYHRSIMKFVWALYMCLNSPMRHITLAYPYVI